MNEYSKPRIDNKIGECADKVINLLNEMNLTYEEGERALKLANKKLAIDSKLNKIKKRARK